MFENPIKIDAIDLERHINDSVCRHEALSLSQKKFAVVQRLLLKVQGLTDKDFETAIKVIESVLDSYQTTKNLTNEKDSVAKKSMTNLVSHRNAQNFT